MVNNNGVKDDKTPSRMDCIPILHVKGTNYSVGLSIGRMFKAMIQDMLESWSYFNDVLWKAFLEEDGRSQYEKSLSHCLTKYPKYVEEIRGMAEGSQVPFEKLFLLNIDSMICADDSKGHGETGCTTIIFNKEEKIIAHTEDAMKEILNNVYIVSATVVNENCEKIEKFTTFSYAGHLMGYTMGFNESGFVHTVNTLFPSIHKNGTPRAFVARAILGAQNLEQLLEILKDSGTGISDGFSLNVHFAKDNAPKIFHNIEVLPPSVNDKAESLLNIFTVNPGESSFHCNRYLRFEVKENPLPVSVSKKRQETIERYPEPMSLSDIKALLSDQSDEIFPVYICDEIQSKLSHIKTVAVGVFNLVEKTWEIYLGKPMNSEPVAVIPLAF